MITFVVNLIDEKIIKEINRLKIICSSLPLAVEPKKKRKRKGKTEEEIRLGINKVLGITEDMVFQHKVLQAIGDLKNE